MNNGKTIFIGFLFFCFIVVGIIIVAYITSGNKISLFSKAAQSPSAVSVQNSYVFASPLSANLSEYVRVTVFLLNDQGLGVSGKDVKIENQQLEINPVQSVSDNYGKALFDVTSSSVGDYIVEATVDNIKLPQKINISFR